MAGGKETPRQKMIGMMYLVLTALLALNVSKEIINAFVKLDQKLMENNALLINQSDLIMQQFENSMVIKENKKAVLPYYQKAEKVRAMVYEIDKFINLDCKNQLIKAVEGKDWVKTDEKTKRFITNSPMGIETKDDYDAATRLFGGEKGTEGYERGASIRTKIHKYRDDLISFITNHEYAGKKYQFHPEKIDQSDSTKMLASLEEEVSKNVYEGDRDRIKSIYKILTLPEKLNDHEETVDWQVGMFDHAPVVAASALFTSLSNDIRQSEVKALEILHSRISVPPFPVNKIEPMAYAKTNYINLGDSLNLRVNIAAYDTTNVNPIRYKESEEENAPWIEWTGNIKLKGNKTGKHKIKGQIGVKERGVLTWKDWDFDYEVGQPTAVISNADLNVVYVGIENRIEATASGYAPEDISVTGFNGIRKSGDYYLVKPSSSMSNQIITINVSAKESNGSNKSLGKKQFKVKRLPLPNTFIGSANNLQTSISLVEIMRTKTLSAAYGPDVPITCEWRVIGFKLSLSKDGVPKTLTSNTNKLTADMEAYLKNLPNKTNISFTDIKVVGPAGNVIGPPMTFILK